MVREVQDRPTLHWENYISISFHIEYDSGDSFPSDFEPNGIPLISKPKGKHWSYPIQYERKWNASFLSVI